MARTRSKSEVISRLYENFSLGPFISRKQIAGIVAAVVCGLVGIGLVLRSGGFAAAGMPCAIAFGAAFVIAIYSATKLFSTLVDHRDAKRFIQARALERGEGIEARATANLPAALAAERSPVVVVSGYSPSPVRGEDPVFYVEDTGKAHSSHYERSALFIAGGDLHWLKWIYRLDTPEVVRDEYSGTIPCQRISLVSTEVYEFPYEAQRKSFDLSYPYLRLVTDSGDDPAFSLAHFDPFDDAFDADQKNEAAEIHQMICDAQKTVNGDSRKAVFRWML